MTVEELFPIHKDCSQITPRKLIDCHCHSKNQILSYCASTNKDLSFRHIFENADLSAAMDDHDYFDRKYVEFWVDHANMVSGVTVCGYACSNHAVCFFSVLSKPGC